jgi:hypothetical protein
LKPDSSACLANNDLFICNMTEKSEAISLQGHAGHSCEQGCGGEKNNLEKGAEEKEEKC